MVDRKVSVLFFVLVAVSVGCAPKAYRTHREAEGRGERIGSVGLAPCDARIHSLSAGGVQELRDDWCDAARSNIGTAVKSELSNRSIAVTDLSEATVATDEFREIAALYRAVSLSILQHAYGDHPFPSKQTEFDYTVGPIEDLLAASGADALIFAYGYDQISTGGRKALMFLGVLAGAVTGVVVTPVAGTSIVSIAMVDASGDILWHSVQAGTGGYDLRDASSTETLIRTMFEDFPR